MRLCRICGSKEGLIDIMKQGPAMLEKLSNCANINIKSDDFLPKHICQQCDHMLDMSHQLRMKSEHMQQKLQQDLKKPAEATDIHYISDDDICKSAIEPKVENTTATQLSGLGQDEDNTRASGISNLEEFRAIEEQEFLDAKSESTEFAPETEETANVNGYSQVPIPDDIDSSESFDIATSIGYHAAVHPPNATSVKQNNAKEDEFVDIGDVTDQYLPNNPNTSNEPPPFISAVDYCSAEMSAIKPELAANPDFYQDLTQVNTGGHSCQYCQGHYSTSYNLIRHIKACHTKDGNYKCDICQVSYARQDVLSRHILQIHTNKKWHCKICGESFRSAFLLNVHKYNSNCAQALSNSKIFNPSGKLSCPLPSEYIIKVSDNRYKCVHCNALFKNLSSYKTHLLIHEDVRPFPCSTCPKSFRTRYAMVNHERIHSNERPFKCEICHKQFRQVTHLKHHRYQHKKEDMPFKCTTCKVGFITKWKLRDHLRKHYTEKAFKCAECPEDFFLKYDLKKHARVVHKRSVVIADSDNEGNQNNQMDITEGTTETDKTDDERNMGNELEEIEEVIDILDDDEDNDYPKPTTDVQEDILVLNEAEANFPRDVDNYIKEQASNLYGTAVNQNCVNEAPVEVVNKTPEMHFINFVADDPSTEISCPTTNSNEKEVIIDFINLDEETETPLPIAIQASHVSGGDVANDTTNQDLEIIHLDEEDDDDDGEEDVEKLLKSHKIQMGPNALALNKTTANIKIKPQVQDQNTLEGSTMPCVPNEVVNDYIHLDSSNSCKSPPPNFHHQYYDSVVEQGLEQDEIYDTITEEKIEITEEKIETFTSYYKLGNMSSQS